MVDDRYVARYAAQIAQFFNSADSLAILEVDADRIIQYHNRCFKKLLGRSTDLTGLPVRDYLLPESRPDVELSPDTDHRAVRLNFTSAASPLISMDCHLFRNPNDALLVFGNRLMVTNEQIIEEISHLNSEMANMTRELNRKNRALKDAQARIKVLGGILPICSFCKEIRDDQGYWTQLESYIDQHSEAEFSHGICDKCMAEHYPDDDEED